MIAEQRFTRGDLLPDVRALLRTPEGRPVDLSVVGTTVKFRLLNADTGLIVLNDVDAEIVSPGVKGEVRYVWQSGQTDVAGNYWAWFHRTVGGRRETYPTGREYRIVIEPRGGE